MKPNDLFTSSSLGNDLKLAKSGDADASMRVGYQHFTGKSGIRNWNLARSYFKAALPEPMAAAWLSYASLMDPNFEMTEEIKRNHFHNLQTLAFNKEDPVGQTLLARLYEHGRLNKERLQMAKSLYEQAAPFFALAGTSLARIYLRENRIDEAKAIFADAAMQGEVGSMVELAELMLRKLHEPAEKSKAKDLLKTAAERGDIRAQYQLAMLYHNEATSKKKVNKNKEKKLAYAFKLFERCANHGYPPACAAAEIYRSNGFGIPQNEKKAKGWAKHGSEIMERVAHSLGVSAK